MEEKQTKDRMDEKQTAKQEGDNTTDTQGDSVKNFKDQERMELHKYNEYLPKERDMNHEIEP